LKAMDGAARAAQSMDRVAFRIKPGQRCRYLRPCRGLMDLPSITPDCAPTADAVCAISGAVNPSALPGFNTSQIKREQVSCRYIQMKNALGLVTLHLSRPLPSTMTLDPTYDGVDRLHPFGRDFMIG